MDRSEAQPRALIGILGREQRLHCMLEYRRAHAMPRVALRRPPSSCLKAFERARCTKRTSDWLGLAGKEQPEKLHDCEQDQQEPPRPKTRDWPRIHTSGAVCLSSGTCVFDEASSVLER